MLDGQAFNYKMRLDEKSQKVSFGLVSQKCPSAFKISQGSLLKLLENLLQIVPSSGQRERILSKGRWVVSGIERMYSWISGARWGRLMI